MSLHKLAAEARQVLNQFRTITRLCEELEKAGAIESHVEGLIKQKAEVEAAVVKSFEVLAAVEESVKEAEARATAAAVRAKEVKAKAEQDAAQLLAVARSEAKSAIDNAKRTVARLEVESTEMAEASLKQVRDMEAARDKAESERARIEGEIEKLRNKLKV